MAFTNWDGLEVSIPVRRPRGRSLSPSQARRLRDLACWMLMDCLELSMVDVEYILSLAIARRQLYDRRNECKLGVQQYMEQMREVKDNVARLGRV